jgi:hypothetical protein
MGHCCFLLIFWLPVIQFCLFQNQAKSVDGSKNCVHYYACISAFASDPKLVEEFSQFLLKDITLKTCHTLGEFSKKVFTWWTLLLCNLLKSIVWCCLVVDEDESQNALTTILQNSMNQCEVEVEVLGDASAFLHKDIMLPDGMSQVTIL